MSGGTSSNNVCSLGMDVHLVMPFYMHVAMRCYFQSGLDDTKTNKPANLRMDCVYKQLATQTVCEARRYKWLVKAQAALMYHCK